MILPAATSLIATVAGVIGKLKSQVLVYGKRGRILKRFDQFKAHRVICSFDTLHFDAEDDLRFVGFRGIVFGLAILRSVSGIAGGSLRSGVYRFGKG